MVRSLLSVLLLGMVAAPASPSIPWQQSLAISVAPPAKLFASAPPLTASGFLVVDLKSGQRIIGRQEKVQRPMASLTKLMTALIIVENHKLDEWVTVPSGMENIPGNTAGLEMGDTFTVEDLLSAMVIYSANDAAEVLARYHSGSRAEFVKAMNERAAALGLRGTSYANPMGLDDPAQWSTPEDLAGLTMYVQRYAPISERMATRSVTIKSREGRSIGLTHTHALLHSDTPVYSGKTGTTAAAGECLISLVKGDDGRSYVVVLLQSQARYTDMRTLLRTLAPVAPPIDTAIDNESTEETAQAG